MRPGRCHRVRCCQLYAELELRRFWPGPSEVYDILFVFEVRMIQGDSGVTATKLEDKEASFGLAGRHVLPCLLLIYCCPGFGNIILHVMWMLVEVLDA